MKKQIKNNPKGLLKIMGALAFALSFALMTALPAVAAEKVEYNDVIINGYKLGFFEQLALEDYIDLDIADGLYWFEMDTGMWGPLGRQAIGHIDIPADYQEYVKSRLNPDQAALVEYSAPTEDCDTGCLTW